ncbi:NmrA/HSCARG family protein [Amycolatopsis sp. NPDC051128]|uniref:NmrA/HSCARG family protein n=1 Tax=Amycolatopsis sp. NPDC051128 TaxID=3155412 RepID=UPI003420C4CF
MSLDVLVVGATGQQGGAVARELLGRGHVVRALTRKPDSAAAAELAGLGAEVVYGDLAVAASIEEAAHGADAAFLLSDSFDAGTDFEITAGVGAIDGLRRAGVGHIVYTSAASADRDTGVPHFDSKAAIERYLRENRVPHTIVAPAFFMENRFFGLRRTDDGWLLPTPMPAARALQQIAVADIAGFVRHAVEHRDDVLGERFDIAGDDLTGASAAAILELVIGEPVRYTAISPDAPFLGPDLSAMFRYIDRVGFAADIAALRADFPDVGWHTFEEWAGLQDWQHIGAKPIKAVPTA